MYSLSTILHLRVLATACLISALNAGLSPVSAQNAGAAQQVRVPVSPVLSYADLADLAIMAPLIAKAQITEIIMLPAQQSVGVRTGFRRAYVSVRVSALIRGEGGIAPVLSYIYDVPLDARGKVPKLKKRNIMLFARQGSRPGQIQLVAPDAQIDWTPAGESSVRAIISTLLGPSAPPQITDIGDAFHVAGTVAGEGETQIFLKTDSGQPVSLSIVRRPGQPPRWAVALGEIVDEAAAMPVRDTLLWYRLACALPPALPQRAVRTLSVQDAESARADYKVVIDGLGRCIRTRPTSATPVIR